MLNIHHARTPRWTPLALAISAALAGQAAHAQTQTAAPAAAASAAKAETNQLDTVVVTGIRRSIQSAIDRKKNASTVTDSIVAEDIDQFPDKNVGEALSRITGVQLSREFGEGSQVSIRGVEPDLNRVEINGMSVLGTNGGAGRGAELRELASELIASIDVVKGSTADVTEGGVGGTVRINTRKPLDFTKRTIAGSLSAEQGSLRGGVQPRGSLLLADKFFDGKLGVMANLVYDNIHTRGDFSRNTSWNFLRDWDFSPEKTITSLNANAAAVTTSAGCSALAAADRTPCLSQWFDYAPRIARYGIWERDHKRSSAEVTAQYKFSKDLDAYVSHQVNTQAQRLNDMNFGTDLTAATRLSNAGNAPVYSATAVPSGGTCTGVSGAATPAGMVVENHHVTQYTVGNCLNVAGQGGQGAFGTSARDFALDIESKYTTAGFKYKNNNWRIEGLLGDSKSDYKSESNAISLTQNAPGLVVTLDDQRLPHFTFPANYSPDDASSYVQAQLQYRPSATQNKERQGKLDLQYNFDHSFFQSLWFGGQVRDSSSRQYNGGGYLVQNNGSLTATDEAVDINARGANVNQTIVFDPLYTGAAQRPNDSQTFINSGFKTSYVNGARMQEIINAVRTKSPGTFFGGYGDISGVPANWTAPSYAAAASSGIFDTSAFNHGYLYETPGSDGKTYPQIPAFDVSEKIKAAYVRLDWGTEILGLPLDGNVGVRYARTDVTSTGIRTDRTCNPATVSSCSPVVNSNTVVTLSNSYNDVLPSLNGTLQLLNGKLLVRGGWAKVMARPAINLLAPNVTCTTGSGDPARGGDGTDDCSAGNPDLKPYRATKYDLSLEYYPSRDTQVSLATFRTDINTYVRTGIVNRGVNFYGDGRLFDVTQAINGEGARTQGLELAGRTALTFLPGWASNFGVDANVTRMTFSYAQGNELISPLDNSVLPYPGLSKMAYNLGLWYDDGQFNARVAYHHRDKYYTGGNDVSGNPNFRDKTAYLDAKLQWKATKNFTFAIEAKNLTDQAELTYAGDLSRPNELAWSGRRYYLTIGYKL
ncbi:TonB-dependent receptor [Roseateles asaccharophilus]|uniref:TonB-dependent receptor n=1 Tax=Roseateles asaccharophilus TaxID=582607 RepID=A0ABU2A265_9BURK|nr:TonB-dependent receptor [Roseateles asaccharophilus]MDR7331115.1 TonB-dependent receptor [Roseateles asaccharophilus]